MSDCQNCTEMQRDLQPVPYIAHESALARIERSMKRVITALIVVVVLWFATIGIFILYLNQYDFEDYMVELSTDGGGNANYIGQDGDIFNGTSSGSAESTPQT